jgi:hypothetical protein
MPNLYAFQILRKVDHLTDYKILLVQRPGKITSEQLTHDGLPKLSMLRNFCMGFYYDTLTNTQIWDK